MAEDRGGGDKPSEEVTEGPWTGWRSWRGRDSFEGLAGPFFTRRDEGGGTVCGCRLEPRHMNGLGGMHGGAMMTFADFALFRLSAGARGGPGVTVNLSGDFLGSARPGELIEARGEVTRAGASLVFVRGLVTAEAERRPVLSFTGVIKRIRPRAPVPPPAAAAG